MTSLSLLEEARRTHPAATDLERMEHLAAKLVEELDERPPVDLNVVASYRDIAHVVVEPLLHAGSLTPEPRGLVMRLNSNEPPTRRRFTGFHEVGHTFQPGYREERSFRCEVSEEGPSRRKATVEELADAAAAALLLPRRHFEPDLVATPFGWDGLDQLATRYEASRLATAIRAIHLAQEPMLFVRLEPGLRRAERGDPGALEKLRVVKSVANGGFPFVPTNKSVRQGGVLERAFGGEAVDDMTDLGELGLKDAQQVQASARQVSFDDESGRQRHQVVAIFRLLRRRP